MNEGTLHVQGTDYRWSIHRQPRWCTGRHESPVLLGLAVRVRPLQPGRRALVLEFAIDPTRHGDMPQHQRFRLQPARLIRAVEEALAAGWDPDSRGKPHVHEAGPLQPR